MNEKPESIIIRKFIKSNIENITSDFMQGNWIKPKEIFEKYYNAQENGKLVVFVARTHNQFVGYVTLKWQSSYQAFLKSEIPEIMDLNVLPSFRKFGIGTMLLKNAEKEAFFKSNIVGLGVGLYSGHDGGYGAAQKLYIKLGYIPDEKGITYNYQYVVPGKSYIIDDNLCLWLIKKIKIN